MKNTAPITLAQNRFLQEYAKTLNAEHSADFAGYKTPGAKTQAKKLLLKEKFLAELERIIEENARHLDVSRGYVVKKYLEIINYALKENIGEKSSLDAVLALRALDGLCKQLNNFNSSEVVEGKENLLETISGLNFEKI